MSGRRRRAGHVVAVLALTGGTLLGGGLPAGTTAATPSQSPSGSPPSPSPSSPAASAGPASPTPASASPSGSAPAVPVVPTAPGADDATATDAPTAAPAPATSGGVPTPVGGVPTIPAPTTGPTGSGLPTAPAIGSLTIQPPASLSATGEAGSVVQVAVTGIVITDDRGGPPVFTATVGASPLVGAATTVTPSQMTWTTTSVRAPDGTPLPGLAGPGGPLDGSAVIAVGPGADLGTTTVVVDGLLAIPATGLGAGEYELSLTTSIS